MHVIVSGIVSRDRRFKRYDTASVSEVTYDVSVMLLVGKICFAINSFGLGQT